MKIIGCIPNHILKLIDKDQRPKGVPGMTAEEALEACSAKCEREMHDTFEQWLNLNGIPYIHSRMDKKSTNAKGTPDFIVIYQGKAICLEFKMPYGQPTDEQCAFLQKLRNTGTYAEICYSAKEGIDTVKSLINLITQ